jgi:hypothetical protein
MPTKLRVWIVRLAILIATCFGVFVLPFLIPAPYFRGVSASNLAGFNNRVAALAAAGLGTLVFSLALKWPQIIERQGDRLAGSEELPCYERGPLSRLLVTAVALLWGGGTLLFGLQVIRLGMRYLHDWGYFINRASMNADFGRRLYSQIEFSYGPLLFYSPIATRAMLHPFHASMADAYLATLVLETVIGLLLVAYVTDHLPMSRRWKAVIFALIAASMVVGNMGLNYTYCRFAAPIAFLTMVSQRKRLWAAALWIFAGEMVCLGLSPEIGLAFLASSFAFALYKCFTQERAWILGVATPFLSATAFLLIAGRPYLRMLGMFSRGISSFPVEPLPFVLLFLFALVWLVPLSLATFFRQQRSEAPILAAFYVVTVALLPAAFGRADPGHVFWNGLSLFLLSIVAISSKRRWQQIAWVACLTLVFLGMSANNVLEGRSQIGPVLHSAVAMWQGKPIAPFVRSGGFNLLSLQTVVGHDPIATPVEVPLPVEEALRESGQYTPSFYNFSMSVLDAEAEERQIQEFNQSKWALIPAEERRAYVERPEDLKFALGFRLPYRSKRPVYAVGLRFEQNLTENWRVRGRVGNFLVYEHE